MQHHIPSTIQRFLLSFQDCFTKPGFENFVRLTIGVTLCDGRHSISRVIQASRGFVEGEKHFSSLYRFLSHGAWCADALGRVVFTFLLPLLPVEVIVIGDDTLCHRSGPHIFGAGMHHDAGRSSYGRRSSGEKGKIFSFGHSWVVLAVWLPCPGSKHRGYAIPLIFRLYRRKKGCPETLYRKRTELLSELVGIFATWLPADRRLHLVADREYACRSVVPELPERAVFTGPMPMNAAIYEEPVPHNGRGRPRVKGQRLPAPEELAKNKSKSWTVADVAIYGRKVTIHYQALECLWPTVCGARKIKIVVTRDPHNPGEERAYFCTDPTRTPERIIVTFARRWSIEVAFHDAKQLMGIEDPENGWWSCPDGKRPRRKQPGPQPKGKRGKKAVDHTVPLMFATYALVILWYLQHGDPEADVQRVREEVPGYQHKRHPSFADMLAAIRAELWAARFSATPLLKRVSIKIRELLPHWMLAA